MHRAALLAHVRRTGRPCGAHDLIIAATARATEGILINTDAQAGCLCQGERNPPRCHDPTDRGDRL
jgi:predicted nucleic acid-binding protein